VHAAVPCYDERVVPVDVRVSSQANEAAKTQAVIEKDGRVRANNAEWRWEIGYFLNVL
jgi:hypothetical protein